MKRREVEASEILEIIRAMPACKDRIPKFKRPRPMTPKETYSWLINDWMPGQADFDNLATLTILCGFDMVLVTAAIVGGEKKFLEMAERKVLERKGEAEAGDNEARDRRGKK